MSSSILEIELDIKAMSVNGCWQGKRYRTKEYLQYVDDVSLLLTPYMRRQKHTGSVFDGKVVVDFIFHMKNAYRADLDNPIKPLLDILVKNKIIKDDRKVWGLTVEKIKSDKDKVEIKISNYIE